jgi:hypothetical protein
MAKIKNKRVGINSTKVGELFINMVWERFVGFGNYCSLTLGAPLPVIDGI